MYMLEWMLPDPLGSGYLIGDRDSVFTAWFSMREKYKDQFERITCMMLPKGPEYDVTNQWKVP